MNKPILFFSCWSWRIPKEMLDRYECIGFHMTDLPYGRGGNPLQNLIVRGHKQTMITAFKISEKIDGGDIYSKRKLSLNGSANEIYKRAMNIIYNDMIPYILEHKIKPVPQKGKVTIFKRRKLVQSDISKLDNLAKVYDYIRMLDDPSYPYAFVNIDVFKIEFFDAELKDDYVVAKVRIKKLEG